MKSDLPKRSFEFATRIVRLCQLEDKRPWASRTIASQLLRSGTSIGANIEEGQTAQNEADFISKYSIACKEARETHYWLRLMAATDLVAETRLDELHNKCNELIAILTTIIRKMRGMT